MENFTVFIKYNILLAQKTKHNN